MDACLESGTLERLLNSKLLKKMVEAVDYEEPESTYNKQMKMLLEIHLKLSDLHEKANQKKQITTNLKNTEGILDVKMMKHVLQEKDQFEFLKYYLHF